MIAIIVIFSILKWCNLYHALLQAPISLINPHFFTLDLGYLLKRWTNSYLKDGPTFMYLSSYLNTLSLDFHGLFPSVTPKRGGGGLGPQK